MGSQSRREYTYRVIEHTVPRGAAMADQFKAIHAAALEYWDLNNMIVPDSQSPTYGLPDDWAVIDADDEHVIIRLTEKRGSRQ